MTKNTENHSKLMLGAAQFGMDYGVANNHGKINVQVGSDILKYARSIGVESIDTAIVYGDSERTLGQIGMESWSIITKLPPLTSEIKDIGGWVESNIYQSLDRLKINALEGVLVHKAHDLLSDRGLILAKSLVEAKLKGLVKKIGISLYDFQGLEEMLNLLPVDIIQCPVNIFDSRLQRSGWIDRIEAMNIEVHARSVFLQGLLLMPASKRNSYFRRWDALFKKWDLIVNQDKSIALGVCLRHVYSLRFVKKVIVGVDSYEQIQEINSALLKPACRQTDFVIDDADLLNPFNWKLV